MWKRRSVEFYFRKIFLYLRRYFFWTMFVKFCYFFFNIPFLFYTVPSLLLTRTFIKILFASTWSLIELSFRHVVAFSKQNLSNCAPFLEYTFSLLYTSLVVRGQNFVWLYFLYIRVVSSFPNCQKVLSPYLPQIGDVCMQTNTVESGYSIRKTQEVSIVYRLLVYDPLWLFEYRDTYILGDNCNGLSCQYGWSIISNIFQSYFIWDPSIFYCSNRSWKEMIVISSG